MDILPIELKFRILYDVTFPDILIIKQLSSEYLNIYNDPNFWQSKAQHQLHINPKMFRDDVELTALEQAKKSSRQRFIILYTKQYPIPGSNKYHLPINCIGALLNLIVQGYVEFQDYDLFELLQYYLSMDDVEHNLLARAAFLSGLKGLITIIYYLLKEATKISNYMVHRIYHNSLVGLSRGNQIELLNVLVTKLLNSTFRFDLALIAILIGASQSSNINLMNWVWEQHPLINPFHAIKEAIKYRQSISLNFFKSKGVNIKLLINNILNNDHMHTSHIKFGIDYLSSITY